MYSAFLRSNLTIWNYSIRIWHDSSDNCFPPFIDEAGPGPIKSKYDALDFDTLLKEAQKSMHRWQQGPCLASLSKLQQHPSDYTSLPSGGSLSTSMQGDLTKCLHFYHWNKVTIRTLIYFFFKFLSPEDTAEKKRGSHWEFGGNRSLTAMVQQTTMTVLCWTKLSVTSLPHHGGGDLCSKILAILASRWSLWCVSTCVCVLCSVCFIYKEKNPCFWSRVVNLQSTFTMRFCGFRPRNKKTPCFVLAKKKKRNCGC